MVSKYQGGNEMENTRYEYLEQLKEFYSNNDGLEVTLGISILREYVFIYDGLKKPAIQNLASCQIKQNTKKYLTIKGNNSGFYKADLFIKSLRNILAHDIINKQFPKDKAYFATKYNHEIVTEKNSKQNKRQYTSVILKNGDYDKGIETNFESIRIGSETARDGEDYDKRLKLGFIELFDILLCIYSKTIFSQKPF